MTRIATALLAALCLLAGCSFEPAPPAAARLDETCAQDGGDLVELNLTAGDAGDADESASIHDRRISGFIEATASMMMNKELAVPAETLRKQLDRARCDVGLHAAGKAPLSPADIYDKARPGVLILASVFKCTKCTRWHISPASGFVITPDGAAVTNYHVLEDASRSAFVAYADNGKVYGVKEVLAANRGDDVAIIQLDLPQGTKLTPLPLRADARVGEPVSVISHPDRRYYSLTTGVVSRYFSLDKKGAKNVPMMAITADYARGSSGAPVFDHAGNVIGIVSSTNSVYYSKDEDGHAENLQMVFKNCVPAASVLKLIGKE